MSRARRKPQVKAVPTWRRHSITALILAASTVLALRAFDLRICP